MLHSLAERREIDALTNAVIMFDKKFNPKRDAHDLEQAVRTILASDPSFKNNLGELGTSTNAQDVPRK